MNSIIRRLILRGALVVVLALSLVQGAAPTQAIEPGDTTPPSITWDGGTGHYNATVTHRHIWVNYSEALKLSSVPAASAFSVTVNGEAQDPATSVSIDVETVVLELATPVAYGDVVILTYTQPATDPIQDLAGNLAESFTQELFNRTHFPTPPTFVSATAETQDWGEGPFSFVALTYDMPLPCTYDEAPAPDAADFTVKVNDVVTPLSADQAPYCGEGEPLIFPGGEQGRGTVVLPLASPVAAGNVVTVSYVPGTNLIWSFYLGSAGPLTDEPVENLGNTDRTSGYVSEGDTISTGDGATTSDPVETSITVPAEVSVSILETSTTTAEPTGFSLLGQQVNITAPAVDSGHYEATFTLDYSVLQSQTPPATASSIAVFKTNDQTIEVKDCGVPVVYPCVASRATLADGDAQITVLTQSFSAWNFGTRPASYELKSFYNPVDMNTPNNAKAGATVPLKFEVFKGSTELTDTSIVDTFTQKINCDASAAGDNIEQYATGSTSLRYENGQFIFNWKTPKAAGSCYKVTVVAKDGSAISANFTLKK